MYVHYYIFTTILFILACTVQYSYDEVKVTNFQSSWRDGMAFCAIIDRYRPDLLNFDDCDSDTPLENLERAFKTAEEELGIIRIVDPEDVCVPKPDDKAVMTYVSFLRHAFPDAPPPRKRRVSIIESVICRNISYVGSNSLLQ